MFWGVLGIPEPHPSAREESNAGEKGLQRVGGKPGRRGLPFQHGAVWKRTARGRSRSQGFVARPDLACRQVSLLVRGAAEGLAADS